MTGETGVNCEIKIIRRQAKGLHRLRFRAGSIAPTGLIPSRQDELRFQAAGCNWLTLSVSRPIHMFHLRPSANRVLAGLTELHRIALLPIGKQDHAAVMLKLGVDDSTYWPAEKFKKW